MTEFLLKYAEYIPLLFVSSGKPRLNTARLMEIITIIAVVSVVSFFMIREVKIELAQTNKELVEVKGTVEKIYDDLYRPTLPGGN